MRAFIHVQGHRYNVIVLCLGFISVKEVEGTLIRFVAH